MIVVEGAIAAVVEHPAAAAALQVAGGLDPGTGQDGRAAGGTHDLDQPCRLPHAVGHAAMRHAEIVGAQAERLVGGPCGNIAAAGGSSPPPKRIGKMQSQQMLLSSPGPSNPASGQSTEGSAAAGPAPRSGPASSAATKSLHTILYILF